MYYARGNGQLETVAEFTHPQFVKWERTVMNSPVDALCSCLLTIFFRAQNSETGELVRRISAELTC